MDFDSSLDDIIKAKNRLSSSSYRPRHSHSPRSSYYTSHHRSDDRHGLSTSHLPNRQRRRYDNNDSDDDDDLIITKPVRRRSQVDPSTIVITKKIEKRPPKTNSSHLLKTTNPPTPPPPPSPPPPKEDSPSSPKAIPLDSPTLLPAHHEATSDLQQQIQEQSAQILELQRLLNQQQQQQQQKQQSNLSFVSDQPASCIVQFDNLDPAATSHDIRNACNEFGPVIRCQVTIEQTGGNAQVEFLDHRAARACVNRFNQQIVDGRLLTASFLPARSVIAPTRSGYRTTSHVLYND